MVMGWVFETSQMRGNERLVALALADNADDHGRCWPSVARIATKARVSRATVKRATQHMRTLGELEVTDRGRHSNLYRFTCGLNLTPQDVAESDVVGSSETVVGSNLDGCGLTREPQNHQEPSRRTSEPRSRILPDTENLTHARMHMALDLGLTSKQAEAEWALMADTEFKEPHGDWTRVWRNWCRRSLHFNQPVTARRPEPLGRVVPSVEQTKAILARL